ncbi:MAG TPA: hypothetical protein PLO25_01405 [Candidatus Saccharibacteria bacterium]|nr:hypothetical protein [Candidatus Saccharibacteria bacterium]
MLDKNIINLIKEKEIDRKDFLKYVGLLLLSIVGLRAFISIVNEGDSRDKFMINSHNDTNKSHGFGGGKYGV